MKLRRKKSEGFRFTARLPGAAGSLHANVLESWRSIEAGCSGGDMMRMNFPMLCMVVFFFAFGLALNGQSENPRSGSWSGVIINANCTVDEAFAEAPKCMEKEVPGAKLALYDDTTRQIYILDPQDQAIGHLGDSMTLTGTLEGNTVHVASLKMHTSIGLDVGQKAPDFSARDQFGKQQTLETLKGPKGTVLLFFRSADW
jgi:hypothetical protein